ncbi:MAG: hypothetical protein MH252_11390 [Thermosynechococcaceae cyanobacterium MS004]|nr:hypothetical protein [Thermosynechococcaceae cyanobacterium MS004]
MTESSKIPQSSYFFLPKLKEGGGAQEGIDVKPGAVGTWDQQSRVAFQHVASSLEVPSAGRDIKSVSSIPDMWARPLSMEMAIHNRRYPIRAQMIEQWQGMLAAIALAEVRGFPLKAVLVELEAERDKGDAFARSLYELLPSTQNALYTLNGKHPWQDVYVFLWNGRSVGMSSPSTLVCPSEEGNWSGLPWWSGGRLRSPVSPVDHLNADEKSQLRQWLEIVRQELNPPGQTDNKAVNEVSALLKDFQNSLGNVPNQSLKRSTAARFFGANILLGPLRVLNTPIQAIPQESSVRVVPSVGKSPDKDLLLIPEAYQIQREWGEQAQNIWIHDTTNLAALNPEDVSRSGDLPRWGVKGLREADVFLSELSFITQASAFPGGLVPKGIEALAEFYEGKSITPLLPINPILLEYLTPEDLNGMVQIQRIDQASGPQVEFILDLRLSGVQGKDGTYRIAKTYPLKKENAIAEVPVLELWPNFHSKTWKEYYAFYYDPNLETFQVQFAQAKETHSFKGVGSFHYPNYSFPDNESNCQVLQLTEFPAFIDCRGKNQQPIGLILIKTPKEVGTTTGIPWKVGVDFGTSFTNIYVKRSGIVEPLSIEPLHHKVTESSGEIRQTALYEYFIASSMELPLSTVLTTRGSKGEELPVLDGRIYIPRDSTTFKPNTDDWIRPNLKWSAESLNFNRLFLKHLILQITAQAAANNVKEIQWALSYPSAFSKTDRNKYVKNWRDLTVAIEETTGLTQNCPTLDNPTNYRTESLAIAQYFADFELPGRKSQFDLVNSTCIDIGGGTSDISIWEENRLVHQCSVQLAGKDLFSQFIQMNPGFLERVFKIKIDEWRKLQGFQFYVKLDVFMRRESEGWLQNRRDMVAEEPEFQGLIQLMTLGVAGLYYYVGLLLKALAAEGKYKTPEITPVFTGGNGSRLLNWLAEGGEFNRHCEANDLFSAMLSSASGFEDIDVETKLSPLPKDEVACGLVLDESHLKGLDKRDEDLLIAGEAFTLNGEPLDWNARMRLSGTIEDFAVPELTALKHFLNSYHRTLEAQRVEGIEPFKGYVVSDDPDVNAKLWQTTTRELKKSLLRLRGNADDIRIEPPFILELKALLQVLGNQWAEEWK